MSCDHDKRFSGVFDLPKSDNGCVACALERESAEGALKDAVIEAAQACVDAWDSGTWPKKQPLVDALAAVQTREPVTEKCMFCETRIEVPGPNVYAVICAPCRQQAYATADKIAAD